MSSSKRPSGQKAGPGTEAMLATALEMETRGHQLYEEAVAAAADGPARALLAMLRDEELVHIGRIKLIHDRLVAGQGFGRDWQELAAPRTEAPGLAAFFDDLRRRADPAASASADERRALGLGQDFERQAVAFYERHLAALAGGDEQEREFTRRMIEEERGHLEGLLALQAYLDDPEEWLFGAEGRHVDG